MPEILERNGIFPEHMTTEIINLAQGKSSLAKLSASKPIPFSGNKLFTFNLDDEIEIVGESQPKGKGGATLEPITISPLKVVYNFRTSDEFLHATDEYRLGVLAAARDGMAAKIARGIDIMAFHGVNPRTNESSDIVGANHFDNKIAQTVDFDSADPNGNVEAAIALIQGNEHEVSGMAMAPAFRSALAAQNKQDGSPMFSELSWGGTPDNIKGLTVDTNSTVSFKGNTDRAVIGNFRDFFRWGYARNIEYEVIEYGDPDNTGEDLKGHNQVCIRVEAYIGWGILIPEAFARIVATV